MNILIVEDEPLLRKGLLRLLRDHDVTDASDVTMAREILGYGTEVDLVLSDVMMPGETGADIHRWVLKNRSDLVSRFAFMTGGMSNPEVQDYVEGCGAPILLKPFTMGELEDLLAGFDS